MPASSVEPEGPQPSPGSAGHQPRAHKPRKRTMKRVLALLMSVSIGLLIGEFIVRVREEAGLRGAWASIWEDDRVPTSFGGEKQGLAPDPELSFTYNPDLPYVNSLGIQAPEISAKDPSGPMRVIVIGDSVAARPLEPPKDAWVSMVGEDLTGRAEVINAAIIGYTIYQERLLLEGRLLSLEPDLVVLQYTLNDNERFLHRFNKEVGLLLTEEARRAFVSDEGGPLAWLPKSSYLVLRLRFALLQFRLSHKRYPWERHAGFARAWEEDSWEFVRDQLSAIHQSVKSVGGRLAVIIFPFVPQFNKKLVQSEPQRVLYPQSRMSDLCEEMGIPLHDLYSFLADRGGASLFRDLVHLNPDGHRLVADEIVRYLEEGDFVPSNQGQLPD